VGRARKPAAAGKPSAAKSSRARQAERKATERPSPADKKIAAQKRRAQRRPSEAETIQDSRRGADTGSISARKETRAVAALQSDTEIQGGQVRKTHLSEVELAEFRQLLLDKRRELIGDMNNLSDEARRIGAPGGTVSSMPLHMADLGSDTWEQELTLGLIENERGLLREIDEALDRIEKKTYGICIATNKPIGKARLKFKPWAKYCIEYAMKREQGLA
jgi:DnaK suppressor protein